jgi:hypothetical protein
LRYGLRMLRKTPGNYSKLSSSSWHFWNHRSGICHGTGLALLRLSFSDPRKGALHGDSLSGNGTSPLCVHNLSRPSIISSTTSASRTYVRRHSKPELAIRQSGASTESDIASLIQLHPNRPRCLRNNRRGIMPTQSSINGCGRQEWRGSGVDDMSGFGIIRDAALY